MNKSLRIRNLNVSYGEKIILNGVDIEIKWIWKNYIN